MTHTQGKWEFIKRYQDDVTITDSSFDREIASVGTKDGIGTDEAQANAELIVKAVNSYQVMKEACQTALANVSPLYSSNHIVIQKLKNALAPISHRVAR